MNSDNTINFPLEALSSIDRTNNYFTVKRISTTNQVQKNEPYKKNFPEFVKPMLCKIKEDIFDHPDWIFEKKYDGFRAIACIKNGIAKIFSRNKLPFDSKYPEIKDDLEKLSVDMILDGEIAAEDKYGVSKFQLLQNAESKKISISYYVFDILYLNGYNLMSLPLIYRKDILKSIFLHQNLKKVKLCPFTRGNGQKFFDESKKNGEEGIIAKDALSYYEPGQRLKHWYKIKNLAEQETVIVGYTHPKGERMFFGSIVLAVKEKKKWIYVGHCGTGFSQVMLENLYNQFIKIKAEGSPFHIPLKLDSKIQWIKPKLVCQIKFKEWTKDGLMRQPVFLGLRMDKKAAEVVQEKNA